MATTHLKDIPVNQLPTQWRSALGVEDDTRVEVYISSQDDTKAVQKFGQLLDKMSDRAIASGLTDDKLAEILDE